MKPTLFSWFWTEICRIPFWTLFQYGFSARCAGGANVPAKGPALLVSNHQSYFDPLLVGLTTWRHLRYLGRESLFRSRALGWMIKNLGCIPIAKEGYARDGLQKSLEILKSGQPLLVFPEGTRTPDGKMSPLKPGVSLLVRQTDAPVIPVGIAGAYDAYPRERKLPRFAPIFVPSSQARISVVIGQPIDPALLANVKKQALLDLLFEKIQECQTQAEKLRNLR